MSVAALSAGDDGLDRPRDFVAAFARLLEEASDETDILSRGGGLLADLVAHDDWLPASHAAPHVARYSQYLLHRDPWDRFSVVSFVWGPGQTTPVHNHGVWGLVGVLRGAELSDRFELDGDGLRWLGQERIEAGHVDAVSPIIGDIHRVANALPDAVSISIHVYGADIGKVERHIFEPDGTRRAFISGYEDAPSLDLDPS